MGEVLVRNANHFCEAIFIFGIAIAGNGISLAYNLPGPIVNPPGRWRIDLG
jgi:hypothetical protein